LSLLADGSPRKGRNGWWSQLIVATLYLKGNRWSVRDDETEATKVFG
jgi:hypothetical protein